jgi:hypothetical protein
VDVHVPQAGQQRSASQVDQSVVGTGVSANLAGRADFGDSVGTHQHRDVVE